MIDAQGRKPARTKRHLGFYLDPMEYRLVRLQAAREERAMADLFKDALRRYLAELETA